MVVKVDKKNLKKEGLQFKKSQETQKLILDSAIKCFVRYGYQQTTTLKIAEVASVSRGAMRHHFTNKLEITKATIEYLFNKRLLAFRSSVSSAETQKDKVKYLLYSYWQQVHCPLF